MAVPRRPRARNPETSMIWIVLLAFFVSAITTLMVVASAHRHRRWSADHDLSGPQKMHASAVPRVGGIGLASGIVAGALVLSYLEPTLFRPVMLMLLCGSPTLVVGLIEDFTKSVQARWRLLAPALSGMLGAYLLEAILVRTGWQWFDRSFVFPGIALILTMFTSSGVVNSFNIIDGMNGLASMCAALMLGAIAYIALHLDDALVGGVALATAGAALGFFVWNYPSGLIFLGDGGAYLLGLMVVESGLMLIYRDRDVSPLAPLMIVAYPVFETVFTMYRRKVLRGRPVSMPDGIHLHTLIYRRLMRWAIGTDGRAALTQGNSMTSPFLWVLTSMSVVPAMIWWHDTVMLALCLVVFVLLYLRIYWQLVRFKTPWWMTALRGLY
jgi:UDP-N-acetylmuramyl pentapeptide phosphotransferase/UDP-N-acetylglucosamine-1-phosphate transferase